jgi:hypothetical protein
LKKATGAILNSLKILKDEKWRRATLYYSASGTLLNPGGNFTDSQGGSSSVRANHQEIVDKADFVASFRNVGEERQNTTASMSREFKRNPEPDQTHERLKKILNKKRAQLPKDSRGVIVLEGSELFMLDDFAIESALYGDLVVTLTAPVNPGAPLEQVSARRNNRGLFRQTSRVSAVVVHKRHVEDAIVSNEWQVYPTNRADADTIR